MELSIQTSLTSIIELITKTTNFYTKSRDKKEKIVDLVILTLDAIYATNTHIQIHDGRHIKNDALADLYEEIIVKFKTIDREAQIEIPEFLHSKVRYWRNPLDHYNNSHLLVTVKQLDDIKILCIEQLKKLI